MYAIEKPHAGLETFDFTCVRVDEICFLIGWHNSQLNQSCFVFVFSFVLMFLHFICRYCVYCVEATCLVF